MSNMRIDAAYRDPGSAQHVGSSINFRVEPISDLATDFFIGGELLSKPNEIVDVEFFFGNMSDDDLIDLVKVQVHKLNCVDLDIGERYFINVRPELLHNSNFILWLCNNSSRPLSLEIDFNELMSYGQKLSTKNTALLRAHGHQLWLDDFTYNLNHQVTKILSLTSWDGIKIDKYVLWTLEQNEKRLKRLINYCRTFTNCVLMEGIETSTQLAICKKVGIDYGQGFHWRNLQIS